VKKGAGRQFRQPKFVSSYKLYTHDLFNGNTFFVKRDFNG